MKITGIFTLEKLPLHNLILMDGNPYLFRISPFRTLSVSDLVEVSSPLPLPAYLQSVGAHPYSGSLLQNLRFYGLELDP